jgi:predicted transposase/invertase (TIGR01784 family)
MWQQRNRRDKYVDKIMRKNLEHPSADLLAFFVSGKVAHASPLPSRISQVFEHEADTLLMVEMADSTRIIFHLEFQSTNDYRMADRMASYYYSLRLKYKMDVVSVVIYTGNEKLAMKSFIRQGNNYFEYKLIDIRDMDPELFLRSERAAEVMLAVLTGRDDEGKAFMIRQIIGKLKEMLSGSGSLLDEQMAIFKILGSIRGNNIQQQIIKEEQDMPIMYDLNKVLFFQQAMQEGMEKGKEEGRVEGKEEATQNFVRRMVKEGMSLLTIQNCTGLSKERLKKIIKEHNPRN